MKISMKLAYQYIAIFLNFSITSNLLHPLQVKKCDSNSRIVVDEDDNGELRLERFKKLDAYFDISNDHIKINFRPELLYSLIQFPRKLQTPPQWW